jgi:hypothetical protein
MNIPLFYIGINDKQAGPYTLEQLRSMWNSGSITANTLYWQEGMSDWKSVHTLLDSSATPSTPPPLPSTPPLLNQFTQKEFKSQYDNKLDNFSDDIILIRPFLGKKADYFISKFEIIAKNKTCWNWAAFLFGPAWLAYRGMYKYAAVSLAPICMLGVIDLLLPIPNLFFTVTNIGTVLVIGRFGNTFYKKHTENQINKIKSMGLSEDAKIAFAAHKGEPSLLKGFLFIIIPWVLLVIIEIMKAMSLE